MKKFTLIELLVVVAIIGILVSILMPSLTKAREMSKRAVCLSNMKQMAVAESLYESDSDGQMALGYSSNYQMNYLYRRDGNFINQGVLGDYTEHNYKFLYCPSQEHLQHKYNTSKNAWSLTGNGLVRTSMSSAPLVKYNSSELPSYSVYSDSLEPEYAILADIMSSSSRKTHQKKGANVVKVAGNGKFVYFDDTLNTYLSNIAGSFSSSKNDTFDTMWTYLSEKK